MDFKCALCFLFLVVASTDSHNHHRGYSAGFSRETNSTTDAEEERTNAVQEIGPRYDLLATSQDAVNAEIIALLSRLNDEIDTLRTQASNLKLQNHLVYKTLRRWQPRCSSGKDQSTGAEKELRGVSSAAMQTQLRPAARQPPCPTDYAWNKDLRSCYRFGTDRITWRMARERCRVEGGDLVNIQSAKEQRFIMDKARKSPDTRHCDFWAGLTDRDHEGDWRWLPSNDPIAYNNWNIDEPNNGSGNEHCMHLLWVFNWAWNDAHCNKDNSCYVCQIRVE